MESGRRRTVAHLQTLYTVVVGVALAVALTNLIDQQSAVPIRFAALPYFVAYLFTLVPFYHGALRHLDIAYFETSANSTRPGALMADWSLLFIESCGLLALALLVNRPVPFMFALIALLAFDAVWAFTAHLAFSPRSAVGAAEPRWAKINIVTVLALVGVLVYLDSVDAETKPVDLYRWVLVTAVAVGRTIWDYVWCWSYYYPHETEGEQPGR